MIDRADAGDTLKIEWEPSHAWEDIYANLCNPVVGILFTH
jgi:hypothetical protein